MSIHRSLAIKASQIKHRNVYTREERIKILQKEGALTEESSVFGLPKTKTVAKLKKKAKKKDES